MPLDEADLRYLDAKFDGVHNAIIPLREAVTGNGDPPKGLISRVMALETQDRMEAKKAAATWGGAGTAIGAAIVAVLAYFGIRPQQ